MDINNDDYLTSLANRMEHNAKRDSAVITPTTTDVTELAKMMERNAKRDAAEIRSLTMSDADMHRRFDI